MKSETLFYFDENDTDDNALVRETCEAVNMNLSFFRSQEERLRLAEKVLARGNRFTLADMKEMVKELKGMYAWVEERVGRFALVPNADPMLREWESRVDLVKRLYSKWTVLLANVQVMTPTEEIA